MLLLGARQNTFFANRYIVYQLWAYASITVLKARNGLEQLNTQLNRKTNHKQRGGQSEVYRPLFPPISASLVVNHLRRRTLLHADHESVQFSPDHKSPGKTINDAGDLHHQSGEACHYFSTPQFQGHRSCCHSFIYHEAQCMTAMAVSSTSRSSNEVNNTDGPT